VGASLSGDSMATCRSIRPASRSRLTRRRQVGGDVHALRPAPGCSGWRRSAGVEQPQIDVVEFEMIPFE
jgi:hypothetical protein